MSVHPTLYQLSEYLEKLPGTTFRRLYQQPSTAFAIFRRMLPHLAKSIVMVLLYSPGPLALADLEVIVKPDANVQRVSAIATLKSLHMVSITFRGREKPQEMQLTGNFAHSMRLALEGGGDHNSFGTPSSLPIDPKIDVAYLDAYARRKWEDILHYVVNSVGSLSQDGGGGGGVTQGGAGPRSSVKDLLLAGNLVERHGIKKTGAMTITQAGFTFLLQEANAQVWTLLILWLQAAAHSGNDDMDSVDMLSFLFMLASLELGRAYDTDALHENRRNMLPAFVDFGLVFIPSNNPRQYFPTRLATTLTSTASAIRSVSSGFAAAAAGNSNDASTVGHPTGSETANNHSSSSFKGGIIVETNFRLYAYTSSPLQIAVLALFAELHLRFASMVSGKLNRPSIRRAVDYGITADQVISYLAAHAHEQMHRQAVTLGRSVLPLTVIDQIRLWQIETERMRTIPGFLFRDFSSADEYRAVSQYACEVGVLTWSNDRKQMFFATKHEQIRDFLKTRNRNK